MRIALALLVGVALSACGGGETVIPGERISVLSYDLELTADPRLNDVEIILPNPFRNRNWEVSGGYPSHALYHLVLDGFERAYRADAVSSSGANWRITASPIIAEGRVYAMGARLDLGALDAQSGKRVWHISLLPEDRPIPSFASRALRFFPCLAIVPIRIFFDIDYCDRDVWFEPFEDGFGGGLAYSGGRLFVATGFGELLSVIAATGEIEWRVRGGVPFRSAPTVRDGRVFVVSQDSRLQVFEAGTGTQLWDYLAIADPSTILGAPSLAVTRQLAVVGFNSGELVAARVDNGTINWSDSLSNRSGQITPLSELNSIIGRPVVDRDRVIAVGHGGRMVAIDLRTGERVWTSDIGAIETPWVAGDFIFVVTTDGLLVAVSRGQGRIRWVTQLQNYRNMEDKMGKILWSGPVLAGGALVLVSSEGVVLRVAPKTGVVIDERDIGRAVNIAPIVADGTLYILDDRGDIHAFRGAER